MFVRVDRGHLPVSKLEAFASFLRSDVQPELRALPGYRSTSINIDREGGAVLVVTAWDTPADRAACDGVLAKVLKNAARFELVPVRIELYEQTFADSSS